MGHDKTLKLATGGPICMRREFEKFVGGFWICQVSKGTTTNARLYMPLPIMGQPWTKRKQGCYIGAIKDTTM